MIVWAGTYNVVTLTTAQILPLTALARSFVLLAALFVAADFFVIQGLSPPLFIRLVKLQPAKESHDEEERECLFALLRSQVKDSALSHSIIQTQPAPGIPTSSVNMPPLGHTWSTFAEEHAHALALEPIHQQREVLIGAHDDGVFSSAVFKHYLERTGYEEILLAQRH